MGQASWPKSSRKGIGVYTPTPTSFITESYKLWWQEWKGQLFAASTHMYRHLIDPEHIILDDSVSFS